MNKIKVSWRERNMMLIKESQVYKEKDFKNPYSYVVAYKHLVVVESFDLVIMSMPKEEEGIGDIQQKKRSQRR